MPCCLTSRIAPEHARTRTTDTYAMPTLELGGLAVPEAAVAWRFMRASGPGGQHVNKVSTAVECRLDLNRAGFAPPLRRRLERLAGSRLTAAGEVVLQADGERSQARNRAAALARLDALVAQARQAPKPRIASQPSAAQKAKRLAEKRRRSEIKQRRQPPTC